MIFFFIPKAAGITLPYRWNNIPLEQPRQVVLQYLGKPVTTDVTAIMKNGETWVSERNNGEYLLNIQYVINADTIAKKYSLDFVYKLGFFKKVYHLKSEQH